MKNGLTFSFIAIVATSWIFFSIARLNAASRVAPLPWEIELRVEPQFPDGVTAPLTPRLAPTIDQADIRLTPTDDPRVFRIGPFVGGYLEPPEFLTIVYEAGSFPPVRDNLIALDFRKEGERLIARKTVHPRFEAQDLPYIVGLQQSLAEDGELLSLSLGVGNPTTKPVTIVGVSLKGQAYRGACYTAWSRIKLDVSIDGRLVEGEGEVESPGLSQRKKLKGRISNCGSLAVGLESVIEVPPSRQMNLELRFAGRTADRVREYEWWEIQMKLRVAGKALTLVDTINTERILVGH